MGKGRQYEVRGTAALAESAIRTGGEWTLIDYDIARRSFEARQRLENRQQGLSASVESRISREAARIAPDADRARGTAALGLSRAYGRPRAQRISMQELVWEEYDATRRPARIFGDAIAHARQVPASLSFSAQLRDGTLAGEETGRMSYRQALHAGAIGLVLGAAIMFLGI